MNITAYLVSDSEPLSNEIQRLPKADTMVSIVKTCEPDDGVFQLPVVPIFFDPVSRDSIIAVCVRCLPGIARKAD